MSELVSDFRSLIQKYQLDTPIGRLEASLDQMKPEQAKHFKLCAIPHQFSPTILMRLVPELTSKETAVLESHEFGECPTIRRLGSDLYEIKEEARSYVFKQWLQSEHEDEFKLASKRLVDYFTQPQDAIDAMNKDAMRINRVFHLIAVDRRKGLHEFEALLREKRQRFALDQCESLARIVHEYDPVLTPSEKAIVAYHEGKIATDRSRWDQATSLFEQILNTPNVDPALRTKALVRLGLLENENRQWPVAITRFKEALEELKRVDDQKLSQKLNYRIKLDLGITYRDLGDLVQAKRLTMESMDDARLIGSTSGVAVGLNSLGTLYRKLGEFKLAIEAYQESLNQLQDDGQTFRIAQVYNNLGLAYVDDRQWDNGKKALRESEQIKRQLGDTIGLGRTYNNLMQVCRKQHLETDAIHAGEQAVTLFKEVGDNYDMAVVLRNLGRLYRSLGKMEEAKNYFAEAIKAFHRADAVGDAASSSEEYNTLTRKIPLPWWAWLTLILTVLVVLLSSALIGIALSALGSMH